ncbi:MAG TPA: sigma-70 family RNA polymerase sigma factor [Blastocatellia bacterium]|nr:sigma-70 family RNA polymerase sigma factor [Blastocatellia bacterium]
MKSQTLAEAPATTAVRDDRELVAACLSGDQSAWESLITRYQRLIYSIPMKTGLSQDDASDIFQSVCLKLYQKLATIRDTERISSWLITTTSRECWRLSARNRKGGVPAGSTDDESVEFVKEIPAIGPLADEQREALEQQQYLRQGVDSLPERCRQLITLLFYEKDELSYVDIARRIRMPVPSVGPTRARCLEKLRKLLEGKI